MYRLMFVARSSKSMAERSQGYLERLVREGFEVHLLAADDGGFESLEAKGVLSRPLPVGDSRNIAGLLGGYFIMQAYFLENQPTLVHVHDGPLLWLGSFAARQVQAPVVVASVVEHRLLRGEFDQATLPVLGPDLSKMLRRLGEHLPNLAVGLGEEGLRAAYRWLGNQVDRYLVTSAADLDLLAELEIVSTSKAELLLGAPGVDVDRFNPDREGFITKEGARRALDLPQHWRTVVGVGEAGLGPQGQIDLVDAITHLHHTHPAVGWVVAPPGKLSRRQRQKLHRLEQRQRVVVLNPQDRPGGEGLALFYRAIDLCCCPSYSAEMPLSVMRAAAMRVPTVGYFTSALADVVTDGQTGILLPRGRIRELIETLRLVIDHPKHLEEWGARARIRALERFDREACDMQMLRLYDSLLSRHLESPR